MRSACYLFNTVLKQVCRRAKAGTFCSVLVFDVSKPSEAHVQRISLLQLLPLCYLSRQPV
jgi:hypothetical protein